MTCFFCYILKSLGLCSLALGSPKVALALSALGSCFILTFLADPMKAFIVLLFIFLLQQFDGFYLGPKILSEKVGLSPLLVILAITIGGGLFGVLGMFLSVPIMALIKTYSLHIINNTSNKEKEQ